MSMDSTTATASMAPAAPRACPVIPLVEVTRGPSAPKISAIATASAMSFSGVEVPWALTWLIWWGSTPASSRARRIQVMAPMPPGDGAVMW